MRKIGFAPQIVDDMEMWQIAVLLETDLQPSGPNIEERMAAEGHTLAERARAVAPESKDITEQVMRQMGINAG